MKPRSGLLIAPMVLLVYGGVGTLVAFGLKTDYLKAFRDPENSWPWIYILGTCAGLGALAATVLGWWGPILKDYQPVKGWIRWIPLFVLLGLLGVLDYGNIRTYESVHLRLVVVSMLLVGFSEELAFRGLVLTSLRESLSEPQAWFWSSVLFGLLHAFNTFLGMPIVPAIVQVILAFISGSVLYLVRRSGGGILPAMAIHALWDFTVFTQGKGHLGALGAPILLFLSISIFIGFLCSWKFAFPDSTSRLKLLTARDSSTFG